MNEQEMRAVFLLAKYDVKGFQRLENQYWPEPEIDDPRFEYYTSLRTNSPWWRVSTTLGDFVIGRRKRVISISWDDIGKLKAASLTTDDVTKFEYTIHAWTHAKAVEYLHKLRVELS